MANLNFDESLVCVLDQPGSFADVEASLANVLRSQGYVKDSFAEAIATREQSYPTALQFGEYNIAMPHCDVEHVVNGAICVGVLKEPVAWHRMDDPEATCDVRLVVMLAINEAHAHLEMLQKVVKLLQSQGLVGQIVASSTAAEAYPLIAEQLV